MKECRSLKLFAGVAALCLMSAVSAAPPDVDSTSVGPKGTTFSYNKHHQLVGVTLRDGRTQWLKYAHEGATEPSAISPDGVEWEDAACLHPNHSQQPCKSFSNNGKGRSVGKRFSAKTYTDDEMMGWDTVDDTVTESSNEADFVDATWGLFSPTPEEAVCQAQCTWVWGMSLQACQIIGYWFAADPLIGVSCGLWETGVFAACMLSC